MAIEAVRKKTFAFYKCANYWKTEKVRENGRDEDKHIRRAISEVKREQRIGYSGERSSRRVSLEAAIQQRRSVRNLGGFELRNASMWIPRRAHPNRTNLITVSNQAARLRHTIKLTVDAYLAVRALRN